MVVSIQFLSYFSYLQSLLLYHLPSCSLQNCSFFSCPKRWLPSAFPLKAFIQSLLSLYHQTWKSGLCSPAISSVQSLSSVRLFVILWTAAHQASLSITNSWSLLKLMSIESVMPPSFLFTSKPITIRLQFTVIAFLTVTNGLLIIKFYSSPFLKLIVWGGLVTKQCPTLATP